MTIAIKPTSTSTTIQQNGDDVLTIDSNGNVVIPAENTASAINNQVIFHDNATTVATGQSAGSVEWKQDGGTLGAGLVGRLHCFTEGTGGSYSMSMSCGNTTGSGASQFAEHMRITSSGQLMHNSGYGSVANAYGCRAWINFNMITATIRGSGNISSITDNAVGKFTITMSTAMPDTNYNVTMSVGDTSTSQLLYGTGSVGHTPSFTTTTFRVYAGNATPTFQDKENVHCSVFR